MASYIFQSLDFAAFSAFVESPNDGQMNTFLEGFRSDEDYFEEEWKKDNPTWLQNHLVKTSWYEDLEELEMCCWDNGMAVLLERPEFDAEHHGFHGALPDFFIEFAQDAFKERGLAESSEISGFGPYRYTDKLQDVEPIDRFYWPQHALLDPEQIKRVITELEDYESILDDAARKRPGYVSDCRDDAINAWKEFMSIAQELTERNRMWYSILDC